MMRRLFFRFFACVIFLFIASNISAQQSFIISFPNFSSTPVQNPQGLTVAGVSSKLQVQLDVSAASSAGADVTIQLPTGIEYVPNSVALVSTNASLTITENGGTANAPQFKLGPSILAPGNRIVFTIERKANCAARTYLIGGGTFRDAVSATIGTTTTNSSSTYQVIYPVFSFTQPASQSNAVVGSTYTRNFTISNGGNGCTNAVYFSVDYPSNGIQLVSMMLTSVNGTTLATPITLTPTSTSGTTSYFTVPAANLPGGDFCNGENLRFTETYTVKACGATTNYKAGWGMNSATWCQEVTGSGSITMASGTPLFSIVSGQRIGFVNSCTPFTTRYVVRNSGSGNVTAAGMYNVAVRWGQSTGGLLYGGKRDYIKFNSATIGSQSGIPVTLVYPPPPNPAVSDPGAQIAVVDVKDKFTTDPDGVGGLSDLDGDGYFDDLASGQQMTIDIATSINCSLFTCTQSWSNVYDRYLDMQYTTMCSSTVQTAAVQYLNNNAGFNAQTTQLADKSYGPSNVYDGVPFRARFSVGYYAITNPFDTNDTRYSYEITLPAGMSVSGTGNILWWRGQYPEAVGGSTAVTYSQTGNVVTVTSPTNLMGYFEIDLVYTCGTGGAKSIPYKLKRIDSPTCSCNAELFCDDLVLANVICPSPCPAGPSTNFVKVERADNSLGWTDNTLTTKQARNAITAYDLSKALYLDEILVHANGVQYGSATNLYNKFSVKKLGTTTATDKLTPIDITLRVIRGGSTIVNTTTTSFTNTSTIGTNPLQYIEWNLTSILPTGGLLNGDIIQTTARYSVRENTFPQDDQQTGDYLYLYNKNTTNTEVFCNKLVPEMYLVSPARISASNNPSFTGCNELSLGSSTHHVAYRFNANGTKFRNEVRPGLLPKKLTFKMPNNYALSTVSWRGLDESFNTEVLPHTYNSATDEYTVTFPEKTFHITVTNNYAFTVDVKMFPTCSTSATPEVYLGTIEYVPYYYYWKGKPNQPTMTLESTRYANYIMATQPGISLTNLSGSIQASKPNESFDIRLTSTGTSAVPYTWMAIPTTSGVNITNVVDIATGTVLSPITYPGGVWFQLSTAGLASAATKDYRINFTYTTCNPTTFTVEGGWNCSSYPTDPTQYTCGKKSATFTFTPQNGEVQILTVQQPTSPIDLCTPINYEFRINSASAGNLVNNTFTIIPPTGLSIVPGTLLAEYPVGSGNWQNVTTTTSGANTILNLTTHPNFPVQGIPGTLNDGGNANLRMMGIRFQATTTCNFEIGSNVDVSTNANKTCGAPAVGDGVVLASNSIAVNGAEPSYNVISEVTVPNGFGDCTVPVKVHFKETIIASSASGTTPTGYIKVYIPTGYNYVHTATGPNATFVCTSTNCPTYAGILTDAGGSYVKLNIPGGLQSQDLVFDLTFQPSATIATGNYSFKVVTEDQVSGLTCSTASGGTCSTILISTGSGATYNYSLLCACYNDANTAVAGVDTKHGISLLQRAGEDNGNWPMTRKSAHTVLESNTKGFVITRMTTAQVTAIVSPQEGMMVYDTTAKCLKIYDGSAWSCFSTPACP